MDLYRNFAAWLMQQTDKVYWNPLPVKQLAEAKDKSSRLHAADKFRQWAAPGELQEILRQTAERENVALISQTKAEMERFPGLRQIEGAAVPQVFQCTWNAKAVARMVHAG